MTPTERTIRYFFDRGIIAGRVDRRIGRLREIDWPGQDPVSGESRGFADLLVAHPNGPLLIQVTSNSGGNHMARVRKVLSRQAVVKTCLTSGFRVEVWSWRKDDDEPRITPIKLDMV